MVRDLGKDKKYDCCASCWEMVRQLHKHVLDLHSEVAKLHTFQSQLKTNIEEVFGHSQATSNSLGDCWKAVLDVHQSHNSLNNKLTVSVAELNNRSTTQKSHTQSLPGNDLDVLKTQLAMQETSVRSMLKRVWCGIAKLDNRNTNNLGKLSGSLEEQKKAVVESKEFAQELKTQVEQKNEFQALETKLDELSGSLAEQKAKPCNDMKEFHAIETKIDDLSQRLDKNVECASDAQSLSLQQQRKLATVKRSLGTELEGLAVVVRNSEQDSVALIKKVEHLEDQVTRASLQRLQRAHEEVQGLHNQFVQDKIKRGFVLDKVRQFETKKVLTEVEKKQFQQVEEFVQKVKESYFHFPWTEDVKNAHAIEYLRVIGYPKCMYTIEWNTWLECVTSKKDHRKAWVGRDCDPFVLKVSRDTRRFSQLARLGPFFNLVEVDSRGQDPKIFKSEFLPMDRLPLDCCTDSTYGYIVVTNRKEKEMVWSFLPMLSRCCGTSGDIKGVSELERPTTQERASSPASTSRHAESDSLLTTPLLTPRSTCGSSASTMPTPVLNFTPSFAKLSTSPCSSPASTSFSSDSPCLLPTPRSMCGSSASTVTTPRWSDEMSEQSEEERWNAKAEVTEEEGRRALGGANRSQGKVARQNSQPRQQPSRQQPSRQQLRGDRRRTPTRSTKVASVAAAASAVLPARTSWLPHLAL